MEIRLIPGSFGKKVEAVPARSLRVGDMVHWIKPNLGGIVTELRWTDGGRVKVVLGNTRITRRDGSIEYRDTGVLLEAHDLVDCTRSAAVVTGEEDDG